PPLRSRLASLPSLTARRPNVDSASPRTRQNSLISRRICSFIATFPNRLSRAVAAQSEPSRPAIVNSKNAVYKGGHGGWALCPLPKPCNLIRNYQIVDAKDRATH